MIKTPYADTDELIWPLFPISALGAKKKDAVYQQRH